MSPSSTVDCELVRATVERAVVSGAFGKSEQLVRFLRFIVEETLAGRDDRLKEYTIAVEALGRSAKFDPTSDSVVRVQARQLRFKLAEYFSGEGRSDPIRIELPKGSYVPIFSAATAPVATPPPPAEAGARRRELSVRWPATAFLIVVAGIVAIGAMTLPRKDRVGADAGVINLDDAPHSLVVLPFLNLTGDQGAEYVSDGMTDELTAALANIRGLRVVARTSAYQFKTRPTDVRTIGHTLGVETVVEGSVRRTGDVVRITVQLSRASDGVHLWAQSFDERAHDLLAADEDVARAVVRAFRQSVEPQLALATPPAPTRDAIAYARYLEARYYANKRDTTSMRRALGLFEEAVARDSSFALAYAGLAGVHATMAINGQTLPGVGPPLAEPAARRAIALNPNLGEAYGVLGRLRAFAQWNWAAADSDFRHAIELNPNEASARSGYAVTLIARGRFDDALDQLRYAQRLDPLSYPIAYSIGEALYYARRWEEALAQARTVTAMESTGGGGGYNLMWRVYVATGRYAEALDAIQRVHDSSAQVFALAGLGRRDEAHARMAALTPDVQARVPYYVACLHAAAGDTDLAFAWLERAYRSRQMDIVSMKVDPQMDALRGDPRFAELLRRIGLADSTGG
jgi:TolB-like protein